MNHLDRFLKATGFIVLAALLAGTIDRPLRADSPNREGTMRPPRIKSPEEQQLQRDLQAARRAGDTEHAMSLHRQLIQLHGFQPRPQPPLHFATAPRSIDTPPAVTAPSFWGNDVLVHAGNLIERSQRSLATEVDGDGNIYVAGLVDVAGTNQGVYVYRSTDNGLTWTLVQGAATTYIQSFGMHVTDTTGGQIIGLTLALAASDTRYDGTLWWVRFREDGSNWTQGPIAYPVGDYGYSEPSVVSDGFNYQPSVTWWYAAAALTDSNGNSNGIIAFRSTDWGATWPYADSVRLGLNDLFPTIEYENLWSPVTYTRRPNIAIPDNNPTGVRDSIFLPIFDVGRVSVRLDTVLHTWVGDLTMRLISPRGDTVRLMNRPGSGTFGSSGNNFIGTVLVDTATNSIDSILATGSPPLGPPYTGFFRPDPDVLSVIDGEQFEGYWKILVSDNAGQDLGTLVRWSIIIEPANGEEVYVSGLYNGNVRLFKEGAGFGLGGTSIWPTYFLTTSFSDGSPDLSIGRGDGNAILPYVSGSDIYYFYSRDAGVTWTGPVDAASTSGSEDFVSANIYQTSGASFYRIGYRLNADTLMYKETGTIANIGGATPTFVNQYFPTNTSRPEVGSHGIGASSNGHLVYAGSGPTNIYYDGLDISVGVADNGSQTPKEFALGQNYPNPFNPETEIRFATPTAGFVTLKIYNLVGQEVATLVNEEKAAGFHTARFDASSFASGVYFYRMQAGSFVDTRKMVLLK